MRASGRLPSGSAAGRYELKSIDSAVPALVGEPPAPPGFVSVSAGPRALETLTEASNMEAGVSVPMPTLTNSAPGVELVLPRTRVLLWLTVALAPMAVALLRAVEPLAGPAR